ncbi:MAG TPA: hypothetical protein PKA13_00875 [Geminicoccaceae bacterium]|nr:hypothetical protein [Geminicoccus sp.]HMU48292.1 hypothetical protein [Geminicoccaceae bacterium]
MGSRRWHLAFLAALVALAAADRASAAVRAADHGKFGRLVFEWNGPVALRHGPTADGIRLELSRPVEGDLAAAAARIAGWLRDIAPAQGGREVDLALPPGVTADFVAAGANLVVLDFERREAAAPARLRAERLPDLGRLIVEPAPGKAVSLTEGPDRLAIEAGFAWSPDAVRTAFDLGPPIEKVHAEGSRLVLSLAPGAGVVHEQSDSGRLVIDLRSAGPEPAPLVARPAASPVPNVENPEPAAGPPSGHRVEIAATLPSLVDDGPSPRLEARTAGDTVELDVVWPEPVPAAAFVRAGRLWLVFGHVPEKLDLSRVAGSAGRLGSLALDPHPKATILTLDDQGPVSLKRHGARWTVVLGGEAAVPKPAVVWPPVDAELRIDGAASLVDVEDPVVGDRLGVAMFLEDGRGEPSGRETIGLEVLPSMQGVVWRSLADNVAAESRPSGVVIRLPALAGDREPAPGTVASGPPPAMVAQRDEADAPEHPPAPAGRGPAVPDVPSPGKGRSPPPADAPAASRRDPAGPVDLAAGALPKGQTARDRRRRLELAVLDAEGPEQVDRRIDLARMLLVQELAAEAGASLAPVDTADPARPAAAALAGIAAFLRGRLDDAVRELGRPWLDGDREVALWRAALAAARHDRPTALREWRRAGGVPTAYPDGLRIRLGIAGAGIELSDGRTDAALALLDRLRDLPKPPEAAARVRLAEARALDALGSSRQAAAALAEALATGDRDTRAEAQRIRIDWDLRDGRIAPEAALARLEAMRPVWRGHPDETDYLDQIGRLRAREGDLSAAMAAWQEALDETADPRARDQLREGLRKQVASSLLGEGDGPALSPLDSLLLYRRHGDLLPEGPALAEVERRLAARLARAGIETPAEQLLRHRLELAGSADARADAGMALAESRLAARDPGSALELLRSTGPERGLPASLAARRDHMRDRAALAVSSAADSGTDGTGADRLRAAWEALDWQRIESISTELLAAKDEPDLDRPGTILALAIARARRGDGEGLAAVGRDHAAELPAGRDRALLAMLMAGTEPASPADLAPAAAGIGAVRTYLESAGQQP